jgi:hypothetical protein
VIACEFDLVGFDLVVCPIDCLVVEFEFVTFDNFLPKQLFNLSDVIIFLSLLLGIPVANVLIALPFCCTDLISLLFGCLVVCLIDVELYNIYASSSLPSEDTCFFDNGIRS